MKTLKESLLDDVGTTMKKGDKWMKALADINIDIKYMHDRINDFDPNSASGSKWYLWKGDSITRATIFFRTPKLTKYFNLPGKHIFITVTFNIYRHIWECWVMFTNANRTIIDNKLQQLERVGNVKGSVLYKFEENGIPSDKASKFSVDKFIQKYVSPMFKDIESFEEYIVKPHTEGNRFYPNTMTI
jgi:hypothetical protein